MSLASWRAEPQGRRAQWVDGVASWGTWQPLTSPAVCTHTELVVPRSVAPLGELPQWGGPVFVVAGPTHPDPQARARAPWPATPAIPSSPHRSRPGPTCSGHPKHRAPSAAQTPPAFSIAPASPSLGPARGHLPDTLLDERRRETNFRLKTTTRGIPHSRTLRLPGPGAPSGGPGGPTLATAWWESWV